ncbi:hypothetical protein BN1263140021 [Stenotrophomonas thermophila]|nr:hypothetical protein BN1263140021 [Stenotrophomonas maltophilia]
MLRTGPLRSSAHRGTVRKAAEHGSALQNRKHLFALAGPAVLGSLGGGPNSRALIRCRGFERSDRLLSLLSCSIPRPGADRSRLSPRGAQPLAGLQHQCQGS